MFKVLAFTMSCGFAELPNIDMFICVWLVGAVKAQGCLTVKSDFQHRLCCSKKPTEQRFYILNIREFQPHTLQSTKTPPGNLILQSAVLPLTQFGDVTCFCTHTVSDDVCCRVQCSGLSGALSSAPVRWPGDDNNARTSQENLEKVIVLYLYFNVIAFFLQFLLLHFTWVICLLVRWDWMCSGAVAAFNHFHFISLEFSWTLFLLSPIKCLSLTYEFYLLPYVLRGSENKWNLWIFCRKPRYRHG